MHVCHVITRLVLGGAQENTLLSCAGQMRRGHRVTLITGDTSGRDGELLPMAHAGGYEVIVLANLLRAVRPARDLAALRELMRWFRHHKPDVVHTHSSKAGILGREAAAHAGVPRVVHTIHGMSFNRTQPPATRLVYRALEKRAAARSHCIISVCAAMTRQSLAAGVGRVDQYMTVYSGMELEPWLRAREHRSATRAALGASDAPGHTCLVGTVARLFANKGHADVIALLRTLHARGRLAGPFSAKRPRLVFVWIGDGDLRPQLQRELGQIGLREHVHMLGLVPRDDVPRFVGGLDIVLHTSRWEGLPRVLPQAALAGLPTLAWDLDGNPEVCQDGVTGRCLPPGDVSGLADAIEQLAADAPLREQMGAAGRAWCEPRFSVTTMLDGLERAYGPRPNVGPDAAQPAAEARSADETP